MLHELYSDGVEVIDVFQSIADLADYLLKHEHPDILFQDIMVSDGNSFDLYEIVNVQSNVIFTTAYDEYAIKAMRNNAVDYLLKPLKKDELVHAIERATVMSDQIIKKVSKELNTYKERFLVRFGNKLHSIKSSEIAYIYSEEKLSFFILKDGQRVASDYRLQSLEKELDPKLFFRANRQFIIHIDSIAKMLRYSRARVNLKLIPDYPHDIIISTENTPRFKKWIDR